ncbi:MAG: hypothetical protein V7K48_26980 [Nostoc sp.]|uniref:hypothetical protein n=1 Tax=Nostoc sp. TaxID=1180 RepID=UPI002FF6A35A
MYRYFIIPVLSVLITWNIFESKHPWLQLSDSFCYSDRCTQVVSRFNTLTCFGSVGRTASPERAASPLR